MKKLIKIFVKEIVPIIVGILIAMYINNWNDNRKDKKYIDQISLSINNELIAANKEIKDKIPLQKAMIDTLDSYLNDDKISLYSIIIKGNGLHFPSIKMNSWKAISYSRIELLDYDKISDLADIEEQKDILKTKKNKLIDLVYPNLYKTEKENKQIMKIMMMDILHTEKTMQEQIEHHIGTFK